MRKKRAPSIGLRLRLRPPVYQRDDGGRAQSRRPRQSNDCTVRAIAIAFDRPYDEVYDLLASLGRKCSRGWRIKSAFPQGDQPSIEFLGESVEWIAFPAVKGSPRMKPIDFVDLHPRGRWIMRTAKHVSAVVDGVVLDLLPTPEWWISSRCVYGAWRIGG